MTELESLQNEVDRLTETKLFQRREIERLVELAQLWRIRFDEAFCRLEYLNKMNPFWYEDDLKEEIRMNSRIRFDKYLRRELA